MIQNLSIRNFKSIRELDLSCKRVNVFIGEPNAGKTNILEALGLGCSGVLSNLREALRVDNPIQLWTNNNGNDAIQLVCDDHVVRLNVEGERVCVSERASSNFDGCFAFIHQDLSWHDPRPDDSPNWPSISEYFLFANRSCAPRHFGRNLAPPFGENFSHLLLSDSSIRKTVAEFFAVTAFKLRIDTSSSKVFLAREIDDTIMSFPYEAASETLRRMIFFTLAVDTHRKAALVLDEPEAHAFPPYTKTLAERIALDDQGNQFFLTTHSPYMLDSLLSKTPADELNVVLCRMEDFETKAYVMDPSQIDQIKEWSMDAFFNFDRLLPEIE